MIRRRSTEICVVCKGNRGGKESTMTEDNKFAKDRNRKKILLLLTDKARALASNAVKIQLHTERIEQSCHRPGTAGEAHKDLLLAKTNDLKKLAELHSSAAKHLLRVAD